jgi:ABC-2 type transport system permease protein
MRPVAPALARYREALAARSDAAWLVGVVLSPVAAQRTFDRIAGTDIATIFAYRDSVVAYHAALKDFMYPRIVADHRWQDLRIEEVPRHRFTAPTAPDVAALSPLVAFAFVLAALAVHRARRLDRR